MDVKAIVKQMQDSGMTREDIIANLQDLGVKNPEELLNGNSKNQEDTAKAKMPSFETITSKPTKQQQTEDAPNFEFTKIEGDEEKTVDIEKILSNTSTEQPEKIMRQMPKTNLNSDEVETKLDDAIALLKSLQEINKKILETNKDILIRIKMN